jgi:glycosyltransferase involved in cell wall biosynthesis
MVGGRGMSASVADVCLILEGTYPFVQGGVSSWVHHLIRGLPDLIFTLLHIGASPVDRHELKYELPPNVLDLQRVFLQDGGTDSRTDAAHTDAVTEEFWELMSFFHGAASPDRLDACLSVLAHVLRDPSFTVVNALALMESRRAWDKLTVLYERVAPDASFVDFYWTWRYTHLPLMRLMRTQLPSARVYHTLSTGYAGWLGACASLRDDAPLVLTEHGIYTRERAIEIAQANWIYEPRTSHPYAVQHRQTLFKQWWINLFRLMSQVTYARSQRVLTITHVNQIAQLRDGADPQKMEVIPNAIDPDTFAALRHERMVNPDPFTVGFVGRVVRIKDVKTFIRAMRIAADTIPNLRVLVVGPTDEEEDYFEDCKRLVELLGLDGVLRFVGQARVTEVYPELDVLVLTSLSEAQPLVLLEANCAGVAAVASNVGACDELLHGRTPEDRALGPSGILTAVASPHETAEAVIRLWREPQLRRQMQEAGMRRVETYYRERDLLAAYRAIYAHPAPLNALDNVAWQASGSR